MPSRVRLGIVGLEGLGSRRPSDPCAGANGRGQAAPGPGSQAWSSLVGTSGSATGCPGPRAA